MLLPRYVHTAILSTELASILVYMMFGDSSYWDIFNAVKVIMKTLYVTCLASWA